MNSKLLTTTAVAPAAAAAAAAMANRRSGCAGILHSPVLYVYIRLAISTTPRRGFRGGKSKKMTIGGLATRRSSKKKTKKKL